MKTEEEAQVKSVWDAKGDRSSTWTEVSIPFAK